MPQGLVGADKPNNAFTGAFRADVPYPADLVPPPVKYQLKGTQGNKDLGDATVLTDPFWPDNPSGLPRKSRFHVLKPNMELPTPPAEKLDWWHAPHSYYDPSPLKSRSFRADGGDDPFRQTLGQFNKHRCSKQAERCRDDPAYRKTMHAQWRQVIRGDGDLWKAQDETLRSLPVEARAAGKAVLKATKDYLTTMGQDAAAGSPPARSASAPQLHPAAVGGKHGGGLEGADSGKPKNAESVHGKTQRERLVRVLAKYAAEKAATSIERQLKREERRRRTADETLRQRRSLSESRIGF